MWQVILFLKWILIASSFFSFVSAYHIIFKRFKNMMAALIPEESCFFVIVVFLEKSSAP